MGFQRTTLANRLLVLRRRHRVVQGGTNAGKTFIIMAILISLAQKIPGLRISVVSNFLPRLKKGAIRDLNRVLSMTKRTDIGVWNRSDYIFKLHNGSYIEFFGCNDVEDAKGGRRDILFINEATRMLWPVVAALISAARTLQTVWYDYNPSFPFWMQREITTRDDCDLVTTNYKDNEASPDSVHEDLERARVLGEKGNDWWANYYRVYGLGEMGQLLSAVFHGLQFGKAPQEAELIGYGMDFGYQNDPTVLVEIKIFEDTLYVKYLIYEKGLLARDIKDRANAAGVDFRKLTIADNNQQLIDELRMLDNDRWLTIQVGNKSRMSSGVSRKAHNLNESQRYTICIDNQGKLGAYAQQEFSELRYVEDSDGNVTNEIEDGNDHGTDAFSYRMQKFFEYKK